MLEKISDKKAYIGTQESGIGMQYILSFQELWYGVLEWEGMTVDKAESSLDVSQGRNQSETDNPIFNKLLQKADIKIDGSRPWDLRAGAFRARDTQLWQWILSARGIAGGYKRPVA